MAVISFVIDAMGTWVLGFFSNSTAPLVWSTTTAEADWTTRLPDSSRRGDSSACFFCLALAVGLAFTLTCFCFLTTAAFFLGAACASPDRGPKLGPTISPADTNSSNRAFFINFSNATYCQSNIRPRPNKWSIGNIFNKSMEIANKPQAISRSRKAVISLRRTMASR